jgi:hypothetical protein
MSASREIRLKTDGGRHQAIVHAAARGVERLTDYMSDVFLVWKLLNIGYESAVLFSF